MWWYSTGWGWWWLAFIAIFFLLPLSYGWGYRGWGPWYRTRRLDRRNPANAAVAYSPERRVATGADYRDEGWGWAAALLWLVLVIALVWLIFAWVW